MGIKKKKLRAKGILIGYERWVRIFRNKVGLFSFLTYLQRTETAIANWCSFVFWVFMVEPVGLLFWVTTVTLDRLTLLGHRNYWIKKVVTQCGRRKE